MDALSEAVERITYYNPENGYTVLRLRPDTKMENCFTNKSSLNADWLATVGGIPLIRSFKIPLYRMPATFSEDFQLLAPYITLWV